MKTMDSKRDLLELLLEKEAWRQGFYPEGEFSGASKLRGRRSPPRNYDGTQFKSILGVYASEHNLHEPPPNNFAANLINRNGAQRFAMDRPDGLRKFWAPLLHHTLD